MNYKEFIQKSINKEPFSRDEAREIMAVPDNEVNDLLEAVFEVRQHFHGKKVNIAILMNAQSGLCPEDCHYCSQSSVSKAPVEKYVLRSKEELLEGARKAHEAGAQRYCWSFIRFKGCHSGVGQNPD